jgi:uncharacterized protein YdeI (YjbR/CyaY-like superfamily)
MGTGSARWTDRAIAQGASLTWETPIVAANRVERHPSDGWVVLPFETRQAFEAWLDTHHLEQPGLWVKFAKKGRGIASISFPEALEVAMCYGWVDSKMHRYDDDYYVLRYQPRRPKSIWSARNKDLAERLAANGRMRPSGLAQVEAAKADGRWDAS